MSTVVEPDGAVATFTYSSNLLSTIAEAGGRTVTVLHDANGNITGVTNPVPGYTRSRTMPATA